MSTDYLSDARIVSFVSVQLVVEADVRHTGVNVAVAARGQSANRAKVLVAMRGLEALRLLLPAWLILFKFHYVFSGLLFSYPYVPRPHCYAIVRLKTILPWYVVYG